MYNFTNAPLPPALLQQQIMQMLAAAGAGQPQGGTGIVPPPPGIAPPAGFPTPMGPPAGVPQQIAQAPQAVPPRTTPSLDLPPVAVPGAAPAPAGIPPQNQAPDYMGDIMNSPGLMEFGLRMMAGSEAQPGSKVGPSFVGALDQAGLGTLRSSRVRGRLDERQERERAREQTRLDRESARTELSTNRETMTPAAQRAAFTKGWPGLSGARLGAEVFGADPPGAPVTREFKSGDQVVTRRWDPDAQQWTDVATAPRYTPGEGGKR